MALLFVEYIKAALRHARYEQLSDDGTYVATIPAFPGVWANAETIEDCRNELAEVLEGWLLLGMSRNEQIPVVDGFDLNIRRAMNVPTADVA